MYILYMPGGRLEPVKPFRLSGRSALLLQLHLTWPCRVGYRCKALLTAA